MRPTPSFREARNGASPGEWYYFPEAGRFTIEEMGDDMLPMGIAVTAGTGYGNEQNAAIIASAKDFANLAKEAVDHLAELNRMRVQAGMDPKRGLDLIRRILEVIDRTGYPAPPRP